MDQRKALCEDSNDGLEQQQEATGAPSGQKACVYRSDGKVVSLTGLGVAWVHDNTDEATIARGERTWNLVLVIGIIVLALAQFAALAGIVLASDIAHETLQQQIDDLQSTVARHETALRSCITSKDESDVRNYLGRLASVENVLYRHYVSLHELQVSAKAATQGISRTRLDMNQMKGAVNSEIAALEVLKADIKQKFTDLQALLRYQEASVPDVPRAAAHDGQTTSFAQINNSESVDASGSDGKSGPHSIAGINAEREDTEAASPQIRKEKSLSGDRGDL
eukprot:m.362752 g.362752  ORF g.362752 m.362752 type:complete len:280 (+) comp20825_c0_seq1:116-955(+)